MTTETALWLPFLALTAMALGLAAVAKVIVGRLRLRRTAPLAQLGSAAVVAVLLALRTWH
jgi:hypothetical protein